MTSIAVLKLKYFWSSLAVTDTVIVAMSRKWCKIEALLLQTINRNWYISSGLSNRATGDDCELPSRSFTYCIQCSFPYSVAAFDKALMDVASYCPSAIAELVCAIFVVTLCVLQRTYFSVLACSDHKLCLRLHFPLDLLHIIWLLREWFLRYLVVKSLVLHLKQFSEPVWMLSIHTYKRQDQLMSL